MPDVVRIIAGAFELSHLPNRAELRLKRTGKVIGYTLSQVRDARGRVTGATLFFKDLTRVEQLEERERLRDRLAALGEMAAAIAHEVKNPLAGIEVMAGLLKRQLAGQRRRADDPERHHQGSQDGQRHRHRGARLRAADPAAGRAHRAAPTCSPTRSRWPRATCRAAGPRSRVDLPADLPAIQGDPHQLRQIFTNLLTNAFEAMEGRGHVTITATRARRRRRGRAAACRPCPMVQVEVADDGPGVTPDVMDKIFSPFFTTKPQGSGLGLAIVRKIVDAHDGRIDVSAREGGGTASASRCR